jgi:hypothetical protein
MPKEVSISTNTGNPFALKPVVAANLLGVKVNLETVVGNKNIIN